MIALSFSLVLALAAQAPAASVSPAIPATIPADILAGFGEAESALAAVTACIGDGTAVTPQRLATLDRRMQAMQRQAGGVWGSSALLALPSPAAPPTDCARAGGPVQLATAAELKLVRLVSKLGNTLAPMRTGVWFGTMPLCGRGAMKVELLADAYTADPFMVLTLDPALAPDLNALTSRLVGQTIAFRTAGRVIAEPQINEAIVGGRLQLGGPDQTELQRAAAVIKGCAR